MDNAGSFDLLAPLLKNHSILSIDLPGHGWSSWIPTGMPYSSVTMVQTLRHIRRHFGWSKLKLMGHSMGAIICFHYGLLYPNDLQFIVSLDALAFFPVTLQRYLARCSSGIDRLIDFEKKGGVPPSYTKDQAMKRWRSAIAFQSLNDETAEILMIRGATKKEDGTFFFNRDYKLAIDGFNPFINESDLTQMGQIIDCPWLLIKASETKYPLSESFWEDLRIDIQQHNAKFQMVEVQGRHHVHMTNPEIVAKVVAPFLDKYDI